MIEQLKDEFLLEIKNIVSMDEIPTDLVINFDQTALNYVPMSHWIMEKEGTKRVEIIAKDDKRQLTAIFAGSSSGDFLPLQLSERLVAVFHSFSFLLHGMLQSWRTIGFN